MRPSRVLIDLTHNLTSPHNVTPAQGGDHGLEAGQVATRVRNGQHRAVDNGASEVNHSIRGRSNFARCGYVDAPVPGTIAVGRSNKLPKEHPGFGHRPVPGFRAEPCGTGASGRQDEDGDESENQAAEHPPIVPKTPNGRGARYPLSESATVHRRGGGAVL